MVEHPGAKLRLPNLPQLAGVHRPEHLVLDVAVCDAHPPNLAHGARFRVSRTVLVDQGHRQTHLTKVERCPVAHHAGAHDRHIHGDVASCTLSRLRSGRADVLSRRVQVDASADGETSGTRSRCLDKTSTIHLSLLRLGVCPVAACDDIRRPPTTTKRNRPSASYSASYDTDEDHDRQHREYQSNFPRSDRAKHENLLTQPPDLACKASGGAGAPPTASRISSAPVGRLPLRKYCRPCRPPRPRGGSQVPE